MVAAQRFQPEREIRFSTYAAWWVRAAMQDYILRNWSVVRVGMTAAQKTLLFNFSRLRAAIDEPYGSSLTPPARLSSTRSRCRSATSRPWRSGSPPTTNR